MKNIIKLFFAFLIVGVLFSCKKNVSMITVDGATPPTLTSNKDTVILDFAKKDNEAIKLSWTNPNYKFSTGLSSQDVSYKIEIDTAGANFTNPNKKTLGISKDLSVSITQSDFNDYLLNQLNLKDSVKHKIEIRVVASLTNNALPVISNVLKYTITPYAIPPKVTPPASGSLFIIGSATPGGWNNPVPVPAQQFTRVSPTFYQITVALSGGNSYLLLPVNGSYDIKYGALGSNNSNNPSGDDFKPGGGDMLAPAVSGNYKIEVDFQRGKYTLTKL